MGTESTLPTFKGHSVITMEANIMLAVIPLMIIRWDILDSIGSGAWYFFILFMLIQCLPRPTYLFFEIKHLLFKDGIADELDLASIIVFGAMSIGGLVLQVILNIELLSMLAPNISTPLGILILSAGAAIGACLGLTDLYPVIGLWPPTFFKHLGMFLRSKGLLAVSVLTTLVLSMLTWAFMP